MTRSAAVPDELNWTLRYHWWLGPRKGSKSREVARGVVAGVETWTSPRECAVLALRAAISRLEATWPADEL